MMAISSWIRKVGGRVRIRGDSLIQRITLGVALLGLASPDGVAEPRVPVNPMPALVPDVEARKLGGKYVLQRARVGLRMIFAAHRSHSSHASHASHASHSSSSHYSGSHYSSSPSPSPAPQPSATPRPPRATTGATPRPVRATFETSVQSQQFWRKGVSTYPPAEQDATILTSEENRYLEIAPRTGVGGKHFYGYLSRQTFDISASKISTEVLAVPGDGGFATFALVVDGSHWVAFRGSITELVMESQAGSEHSAMRVTYDARKHRFWRLRRSAALGIVMWETSTDGTVWRVEHASGVALSSDMVAIELSAGTIRAVTSPGRAIFDNVEVSSP
jgi:hypothetical protein